MEMGLRHWLCYVDCLPWISPRAIDNGEQRCFSDDRWESGPTTLSSRSWALPIAPALKTTSPFPHTIALWDLPFESVYTTPIANKPASLTKIRDSCAITRSSVVATKMHCLVSRFLVVHHTYLTRWKRIWSPRLWHELLRTRKLLGSALLRSSTDPRLLPLSSNIEPPILVPTVWFRVKPLSGPTPASNIASLKKDCQVNRLEWNTTVSWTHPLAFSINPIYHRMPELT